MYNVEYEEVERHGKGKNSIMIARFILCTPRYLITIYPSRDALLTHYPTSWRRDPGGYHDGFSRVKNFSNNGCTQYCIFLVGHVYNKTDGETCWSGVQCGVYREKRPGKGVNVVLRWPGLFFVVHRAIQILHKYTRLSNDAYY